MICSSAVLSAPSVVKMFVWSSISSLELPRLCHPSHGPSPHVPCAWQLAAFWNGSVVSQLDTEQFSLSLPCPVSFPLLFLPCHCHQIHRVYNLFQACFHNYGTSKHCLWFPAWEWHPKQLQDSHIGPENKFFNKSVNICPILFTSWDRSISGSQNSWWEGSPIFSLVCPGEETILSPPYNSFSHFFPQERLGFFSSPHFLSFISRAQSTEFRQFTYLNWRNKSLCDSKQVIFVFLNAKGGAHYLSHKESLIQMHKNEDYLIRLRYSRPKEILHWY